MIYTQRYDSPLGGILLAADESGLTGLWFDGGKHFAEGLPAAHIRPRRRRRFHYHAYVSLSGLSL